MRRVVLSILATAMATTLARAEVPAPTLSITKTDIPDPVIAGNLLTYTLTATNNLAGAALNLTVSDPLPASTVFISAVASPGATLTTPAVGANGTVTAVWDAAGGTPGGLTGVGVSRTVTIVVRVCPEAGCDDISNTATVSADGATSQSAQSDTTVDVQGNLSITTDGPAEALRGSAITYTVTVTNAGPSVLEGVVVRDVLPFGVAATAVETTFPGATCEILDGNGEVVCTFSIGAVNQCSTTLPTFVTITIHANVLPSARTSENVATVVHSGECGSDPNLDNNQSTQLLQVLGATAPALGGAGLAALATLLAAAGVRRLRRRSR